MIACLWRYGKHLNMIAVRKLMSYMSKKGFSALPALVSSCKHQTHSLCHSVRINAKNEALPRVSAYSYFETRLTSMDCTYWMENQQCDLPDIQAALKYDL